MRPVPSTAAGELITGANVRSINVTARSRARAQESASPIALNTTSCGGSAASASYTFGKITNVRKTLSSSRWRIGTSPLRPDTSKSTSIGTSSPR